MVEKNIVSDVFFDSHSFRASKACEVKTDKKLLK